VRTGGTHIRRARSCQARDRSSHFPTLAQEIAQDTCDFCRVRAIVQFAEHLVTRGGGIHNQALQALIWWSYTICSSRTKEVDGQRTGFAVPEIRSPQALVRGTDERGGAVEAEPCLLVVRVK
jgi:hypothetical protein